MDKLLNGFFFLSTVRGGLYSCHLILKIIQTCRYSYLHCTEGKTIAEKSNNNPKIHSATESKRLTPWPMFFKPLHFPLHWKAEGQGCPPKQGDTQSMAKWSTFLEQYVSLCNTIHSTLQLSIKESRHLSPSSHCYAAWTPNICQTSTWHRLTTLEIYHFIMCYVYIL